MKKKPRLRLFSAIILFLTVYTANSQVLVESIAALVGNEVLYLSDLENQVADIRRNGNRTPVEEL